MGCRVGRGPAIEPAGRDARHAPCRRSRDHRRQSGTQRSGSPPAHAQHAAAVRWMEVERHLPMMRPGADCAVVRARWIAVIGLWVTVSTALDAQRGRGGPPTTPPNPRAAAPIDLTGYWVSVVTEDWRYRMVTPPKGQYGGVPLNAEGRRVADSWDPAKDEAAGDQCKAYGAAAIMRVPGRLHITWENDDTIRIDTDAGAQTRLVH